MTHGYDIKVRITSTKLVVFQAGNFPKKSMSASTIDVTIDFVDIGLGTPTTSSVELGIITSSPNIFRFGNGKGDLSFGSHAVNDGQILSFSFDFLCVSKTAPNTPIVLVVTLLPANALNRSFRNVFKSDPFFFNT